MPTIEEVMSAAKLGNNGFGKIWVVEDIEDLGSQLQTQLLGDVSVCIPWLLWTVGEDYLTTTWTKRERALGL